MVRVIAALLVFTGCGGCPVRSALMPPPGQCEAPGAVAGFVLDASDHTPLGNAQVNLLSHRMGNRPTARSDSTGWFQLTDVPAGHYVVVVLKLGYQPSRFELDMGNDCGLRVLALMRAAPTQLQP